MSRAAIVIVLFLTVLGEQTQHGEAQDLLTTEEAMYVGGLDTLDDMTAVSFIAFARLMNQPREDDPTWQHDMIGQTSVVKAIYQHAASVEPPDRFRASHEVMVEAYRLYDQAGSLIRTSIESRDADSFQLAIQVFSQGNTRMDEAMAMHAAILDD
jgi:hypothetical protein